ncbi:MAG: hypothetical protein PVI30_02880 [Myxococcales bacterium]
MSTFWCSFRPPWPLALATLLFGCTALIDADEGSLGAAPMACMPGQIRECPCQGGGTGTQGCNTGGSYDECVCEVGAAGAAAPTGPEN